MDDIVRISAGELDKEPTRYRGIARSHPVIVTTEGRDDTVLISAAEYQRLKRRDRLVRRPWEFTDREIEALRKAEAPPESAAFDHEYQPQPS
jgi:PHD/YefM family antitoxin component YafN of YafNO toxin-antitoxin module